MQKALLPEAFIFCLIIICTVFFGCSTDPEYKPVNFEIKQKDKQPALSNEKGNTIRVAISAMTSPKETYIYYRKLLEYIGDKIDHNIKIIQRKTYNEVNEMFPKRQIDLAFICSGPYAIAKEKYDFDALVTPIIRGEPYYQSYLIVNRESDIENLEDLRDHSFAFTDPDSNTGSLVPQFWLVQMGERANSYFKNYIYTYSHDNSIMAVTKKMVDAAAVDGNKWEYYNSRKPFFTSQTKIIKKSERYGNPPLVTSAYFSPVLKKEIQSILLSMHEDLEGKQILNELMIDRFALSKEEWYETIKEMSETLKKGNK